MSELWLNFTGHDGLPRRVRVDRPKFVIGRQPDCDLPISDPRLSRAHAHIEHFAGTWDIRDLGSSNGTEVDGIPIFDAAQIRNGTLISLGGLALKAEIVELSVPQATAERRSPPPSPEVAANSELPARVTESRSVPLALVLAIPVLALVLVVVAGGVAYLVLGRDTSVAVTNVDADDPPTGDDDTPVPERTATPVSTPANTGSSSGPTPTPANLTETAKLELNGAAFLRKIAPDDPKMFLTTDQAKRVGAKVKQLSGNSSIADNLKSAKQNSAQIKALATENNIQPLLLAIAAVGKLGGSRGDVVATARTMAPVLGKLNIQIGSELADECLLMIAAYEQGAAGDTMKMRNMLQNLVNQVSESPRMVRTIWFLEKKQKITPAEFDRALTFLAIGTLAQNPKDFNVNIEALDI